MILHTQLSRSCAIERVADCAAPAIFRELGRLHVGAIHGGVLEALGAGFVATLYRCLAKDPGFFLYAARVEGVFAGFLAGSVNVSCTLRALGVLGFVRLGASAALQSWRPRLLAQVVQSMRYFRQTRNVDPNEKMAAATAEERAELLAIAVAPEMQGQRIGKCLVQAFEEDLRRTPEIHRYFVSTDAREIGSNRFYCSAAFELIGQRPLHSMICNVYAKELAAAST